ncbi:alpha/beta fold hydrolase [Cellulomonas sp. HZM]|uniref:alpha/beta fold hydrolase n=1 Tax=Cellulomonas sp. HZM TaxID=1454010 RepID=UPI00049330E1|nr:alpha/beta hydrolase [Cellulomonas sp. HZM]
MAARVVLLHGLRTSRTMWREQERALRAAGHVTRSVDLPGHGEHVREPFMLASADVAVDSAVDELGGPVLLVGLSLGGYVAIRYAARHPDAVAGLVAAGCSTRPRAALVRPWEAAARAIGLLPDRGERLNAFVVRRTVPASGALDLAAGGWALDATVPVLRALSGTDPVADLRRVRAPVWLVNGRYDHFRGEERRFLAATRDGRLVVVPRATHLVSVTAPVAFTRVLLRAADEVDAHA